MKKLYAAICFIVLYCSAQCRVLNKQFIDGHPAWIMQGNIYEVNVRQYTPEGTFNAFAKHLDRLKKNGCANHMVHAN